MFTLATTLCLACSLSLALLLTTDLPVKADDFRCVGTVGNITVDNLEVPDGETCQLNGTRVSGNIIVSTGARLTADNVRVEGNIQAEGATSVVVRGSTTVDGSIQLKQGGSATVTDVRINGDLQLESNNGELSANRNTIGGNLQAFQNSGGLTILSNMIDGNLQCKENNPPPTVRGNQAASKEDQCAEESGDPNPNPTSTPTGTPTGTPNPAPTSTPDPDDDDGDDDDGDRDDDGYQDDGLCDDDDDDGDDDACEEHEIDVTTDDDTMLRAADDDIEIRFPRNAVTENTRFRWTETQLDDDAGRIAPGAFGQLTFLLKALAGGEIDDDFHFANPIRMTIRYTDADVAQFAEEDLMLYYRDRNQNTWRPVTETCGDDVEDAVLRDLANNQLTVAVCHLTQFGLFGELSHQLYLPLIER